MYYNTYKNLGLPDRDIVMENTWIYGFTGEAVKVIGTIKLPDTLGEGAFRNTDGGIYDPGSRICSQCSGWSTSFEGNESSYFNLSLDDEIPHA